MRHRVGIVGTCYLDDPGALRPARENLCDARAKRHRIEDTAVKEHMGRHCIRKTARRIREDTKMRMLPHHCGALDEKRRQVVRNCGIGGIGKPLLEQP